MKAPDVIYVEFSEDVNLAFEKQPFEETPAYIRKEALLEWAENRKKKSEFRFDDSDITLGYDVALDELIDKLNEI